MEVGQVVAQLDSEGGQLRPCGSAIDLFGWEVKADRLVRCQTLKRACQAGQLPCRAPSHQACVEAAPLARSTLCLMHHGFPHSNVTVQWAAQRCGSIRHVFRVLAGGSAEAQAAGSQPSQGSGKAEATVEPAPRVGGRPMAAERPQPSGSQDGQVEHAAFSFQGVGKLALNARRCPASDVGF